MNSETVRASDPSIRALTHEIVGARDPQIMRIVATVDAMASRGAADQLVAPLRQRLMVLRPPRPLRFVRLLFHPLDPLIVRAARWRFGQHAIPRTALMPIAACIRSVMGEEAAAIDAAIAGHTDADHDLIASLGKSLWAAAARILPGEEVPSSWGITELGDQAYWPLAGVIGTLLGQTAALDALCAETATGLLPPRAEAVGAILSAVATSNQAALPMMITLLLARLPEAVSMLTRWQNGTQAVAVQTAMDQAADQLLGQLDEDLGTEIRIGTGTLADAGAAAKGIATLLLQLETASAKPQRRGKLRAVRQRLDLGCQARFASGLQDALLTPLQQMGPDSAAIPALEATARGLRVLETEARVVGGGATYDLMLGQAVAAIKDTAMRDRLSLADQARMVEILAGSNAGLEVLGLRDE